MARPTTFRSAAGSFFAAATTRPTGDAGFSLLESIVSLTLFLVVAVSATWWLIKTVQLTGVTRDRVSAAALATAQLERIREERNAGRQLDSAPSPVTVHGVTFTVRPVLNPAATAACPTGQSRQVSVVVSWAGSPLPVRVDSVLAC